MLNTPKNDTKHPSQMTRRETSFRIKEDRKAVIAGLAPIMMPAAPAPINCSPNSTNRWFPRTPNPNRKKFPQSFPEKETTPSFHLHRGMRIINAPIPRKTEVSTGEKGPKATFCATTDPPQTTAAVVRAA
jgi:hypothetical protein